MIFITPQDVVMQVVLEQVVGFESDGVRVVRALFSGPSAPYDDDEEVIVTKLVLTDPPGSGREWPDGATNAILRHAHDAVRATGVDVTAIMRIGAESNDHRGWVSP